MNRQRKKEIKFLVKDLTKEDFIENFSNNKYTDFSQEELICAANILNLNFYDTILLIMEKAKKDQIK